MLSCSFYFKTATSTKISFKWNWIYFYFILTWFFSPESGCCQFFAGLSSWTDGALQCSLGLNRTWLKVHKQESFHLLWRVFNKTCFSGRAFWSSVFKGYIVIGKHLHGLLNYFKSFTVHKSWSRELREKLIYFWIFFAQGRFQKTKLFLQDPWGTPLVTAFCYIA